MNQVLIFIYLVVLVAFSSANQGAVDVRGQLLCRGKPYSSEKVEIWEKNWLLSDNLGISEKTDQSGFFSLKASVSDAIFTPRVYFYFPNFCVRATSPWWMDCGYTARIELPPAYVSEGNIPKMTFDVGTIELSDLKTSQIGLGKVVYVLFDHMECR